MSLLFLNPRSLRCRRLAACVISAVLCGSVVCAAQSKPSAKAAPDVLVLSNGDILHGKLVREAAGKVTFHTSSLGDVEISWDKIKELHTGGNYAVLHVKMKRRNKKAAARLPMGRLVMTNQAITVHPQGAPALAPIPVKKAQFILGEAALEKQVSRRINIFSGWDGSVSAGASMVSATQRQYTFSGSVSLKRSVPSVVWLRARNRTLFNFTGSYGKITTPGYYSSPGVYVPSTSTKTSIHQISAERDQFFTPRLFALGQVAFDHNFSQNLNLQQIYGGGIGWTAFKTPRQEADLKGTVQYEKQQFIKGAPIGTPNLVGSTFSANYSLQLSLLSFTQNISYLPAYNNLHAYTINETNTVTFPTYKNLGFSLGTLDSYLNNPPISLPPTKRNSFQFTMGLTYAIKPKY